MALAETIDKVIAWRNGFMCGLICLWRLISLCFGLYVGLEINKLQMSEWNKFYILFVIIESAK